MEYFLFCIQTLLQILRLLDSDVRLIRLVSRRWDSTASLLLRNRHKVEFVSQREFSCYLHISNDWMQPSILSKFILDLRLLDLDSIRVFAINHGPRVLEYTFSYEKGIGHDESISSQDYRLKEFILLQHAPNIRSLTILPRRSRMSDASTQWEQLPVYRNLRKIVWEDVIYCLELAMHLLAKAPALQRFSCEAVYRGKQTIPGRTSIDLSDFFPILPISVELSTKIILKRCSYEENQLDALRRISEGRNRICAMDLEISRDWNNKDGWSTVFEDLLFSQCESLRNLKIMDRWNRHTIPQLNVLQVLTVAEVSTDTLINLNPAHFPVLKTLTFLSLRYFTIANLPIWASVRFLNINSSSFMETYSTDVLTLNISEVFPTLENFTFECIPTRGSLLRQLIRSASHVRELNVSIRMADAEKVWEELTGGAERVSAEDLLANSGNFLQEECRPHSFGSFHSKFNQGILALCVFIAGRYGV